MITMMKHLYRMWSVAKGGTSNITTNANPPATNITCRRFVFQFHPNENPSYRLETPPIEDDDGHGQICRWYFYFKWNKDMQDLGVFLQVVQTYSGDEKPSKIHMTSLAAGYSVEIVNPNDSKTNLRFFSQRKDYRTLQTGTWGIPKLISKDDLLKYVGQDGKVTFNFDLYLEKPSPLPNEMQELKSQSNDQVMVEILETIHARHYADVLVKTNDGFSFPAHKLVLGARSEYFRKVFEEQMENRIVRPMERLSSDWDEDVLSVNKPAHVMGVVLCHIYNGHLPPDLLNPEVLPLPQAQEIAEASKEFGLKYLQNYLEQFRPDFGTAKIKMDR